MIWCIREQRRRDQRCNEACCSAANRAVDIDWREPQAKSLGNETFSASAPVLSQHLLFSYITPGSGTIYLVSSQHRRAIPLRKADERGSGPDRARHPGWSRPCPRRAMAASHYAPQLPAASLTGAGQFQGSLHHPNKLSGYAQPALSMTTAATRRLYSALRPTQRQQRRRPGLERAVVELNLLYHQPWSISTHRRQRYDGVGIFCGRTFAEITGRNSRIRP